MGGGILSRIVAVSNRVPLPKAMRTPLGGLETALGAALRASDVLWFGWSGKLTTSSVAELERVQDKGVEFATLHLAKKDYLEYYQGYSNCGRSSIRAWSGWNVGGITKRGTGA